MTLEEDEDIGLNPALWVAAGREQQSPAKTKIALTRCVELVAVVPLIILLLPVYALIQVYAAVVCIHGILRAIHRHTIIRNVCIPDVCSASQNLRLR